MECPRRQQILDAAERLFSHYGPGKTTVADIAREAGIGVGSVYLEFTSKEGILVELAARRHEAVLTAMRSAVEAPGSHAERLLRLFQARADGFLALADAGAHAVELVACGRCSGIREVHERFLEEERALVATILGAGAAAGELAVRDPHDMAATVLRAFVAFSAPWIHGLERASLGDELARLHALVVRGLARRG